MSDHSSIPKAKPNPLSAGTVLMRLQTSDSDLYYKDDPRTEIIKLFIKQQSMIVTAVFYCVRGLCLWQDIYADFELKRTLWSPWYI